MSRVSVNERVLQWALERSGKPFRALEEKFPRLKEWLAGERQPTLRQLEELARTTLTPLGLLLLPEPPEERLPIPHFRTLGGEVPSRPSPELLETVFTMQRRQAWMREFLIEEGAEPVPFVGSAQDEDPVVETASRMRRALGLHERWATQYPTWTEALEALRRAMEDAGIVVVVNSVVGNNTHRSLDPKEFRGFVLVDDYAPLVFVNGADGKAAQMFTLAHELAHVFLGSSAAFDLRELQPADDPTERLCNQVAAEFLVPESELRQVWRLVKGDPQPFQRIAREFKVSEVVGARRALDLGLINRDAFIAFYETYQQKERHAAKREREGGDFYLVQDMRLGRRFASLVVQAVREGRLLYSEAYDLTQLYGKTFEAYAQRVLSERA